MSRAWHSVDAVTHQAVRRTEDGAQLAVGHFVDAPPRRDALGPERLDLPDVPDSGDEPLVEQRGADLAVTRTADALGHSVVVGGLGEDVRAEPQRNAAVELENRPGPQHARLLVPSR